MRKTVATALAGLGAAGGLLGQPAQADPMLCPVLGATAPGVPGVVDVTPEGDVHLLGEFFWDCPPYE